MRSDRLLVIDDEPDIAAFVLDVAGPMGFDARASSDGADFICIYEELRPTVLILDLQMPGLDGVELLEQLATRKCRACIILMSGMDAKVLGSAQQLGKEYGLNMVGALHKPVMIEDLEHLLRQCMDVPREEELTADAVRGALENAELEVHYQPVLELAETEVRHDIAAEALLRWRHPRKGLLLPGSFLNVVQAAGLMRETTDYVLQTAIEQVSTWARSSLAGRVSVNIDPELIDDLEFPDRLLGMLRQFDVDPASLVLEVTERGALSHLSETMNILTRVRLKGVGLSIDDFGTGNSSLIQLHRMPFNELKIDRSFIGPMADDEECRVIVKALIEMAHSLGMTVCAEGVESRKVLAMLTELRCDRAQGFLFSEALPAGELVRWRKNWADSTVAALGRIRR